MKGCAVARARLPSAATDVNSVPPGEGGDDLKPTLHYLYQNGIGGILDYAAEDDVRSEGGPVSREPENEHIIARTFDYESEVRTPPLSACCS